MRAVTLTLVLLIAAMAGAGLYAAHIVGWSASLPVHFDVAGRPDGYRPAPLALAVMPAVIAFGLPLLVRILPQADNLRRSVTAWGTALISIVGMLAVTQAGLVAIALGHPVDLRRAHVLAFGVLLVVVGNVLGKVRQNYILGIRTPWTRDDEWVWDQTHRFGGRVFVAAGFALLLLALVLPSRLAHGPRLISGVVLAAALIVCARSYFYWRVRPSAAR